MKSFKITISNDLLWFKEKTFEIKKTKVYVQPNLAINSQKTTQSISARCESIRTQKRVAIISQFASQ